MTFHVRLVSVPDQTRELVEVLAADAGVSNLLVLLGRCPPAGQRRHPVRRAAPVRQLRVPAAGRLPGTTAAARSHVEHVDATLGEEGSPPPRSTFWSSGTPHPVWESRRGPDPLRCRLPTQLLHPPRPSPA